MKATENLDALYLLGLDSRLKSIRAHLEVGIDDRDLAQNALWQVRTELDQLRITIGKDILEMNLEQETKEYTSG